MISHETLRRRLEGLHAKVLESSAYAVDRLFYESADTFFTFEEQLQDIEQALAAIAAEVEHASDSVALRRLDERLSYMEDHFDSVDSSARNRPRRRRQRFRLSDFFKQWQPGQESRSEISDAREAYSVLGVGMGQNLTIVTAAFRRLVRKLHPDARGGDRSTEPQLRKLIAAYDYIKKMHAGGS